jgi:Protein of unknown function (DUF1761)
MRELNYWAVIVTAVAAFVLSTVWYIGFAKQRAELSPAARADDVSSPQPAKMILEIGRNIVLACVMAYFVRRLGVISWPGAIKLALIAWIGFPLLLLTGSVMWENVPCKLAAIHAGDWLLKLLVMSIILSRWR